MHIDTLRDMDFLRGLDDGILAQLAASAIQQVYAPGAIIFLEGETASAIYYLSAGWVKVVKSSLDGREQILRFLGPDETFNELSVFANKANPATAIALETVVAWLLPRDGVRQLLLSHPQVALGVIENMADRVIHLVGLVADLSLHSLEARIARLLLAQAEDDVMHRQPWATQTELAAHLGTVPDVLSRALRRLVKEGILALNRQEIRILDRPALEVLADSSE